MIDNDHSQAVVTWLTDLRRGSVLAFWSVLAPPVLVNMWGFICGMTGLGIGMVKWASVLYPMGAIGLLVGVYLSSRLFPASVPYRPRNWIRYGVRISATAGFVNAILFAANRLAEVEVVGVLTRNIGGWITVLFGLAYLLEVCKSFRFSRLAGWTRVCLVVYVFVVLSSVALNCGVLQAGLWEAIFEWTETIGTLGSFALVVIILRRLVKRVRRAEQGQCLWCGYLLRGLSEMRCAECGTAFDVWQRQVVFMADRA
jgi:hypothetical protein